MPTPFSMPVTSRCGVVSVLPSRSAPVFSSNAATSVKVPPTSADRRIAESRNGAFTDRISRFRSVILRCALARTPRGMASREIRRSCTGFRGPASPAPQDDGIGDSTAYHAFIRLRRQIGDEAMRRRVRDEKRQPGVLRRALRGDAAGPEHRHDPFRRRRHRRRRTAASCRSAPIAAGSPRWIGAPWLNGKRDVTCVAVIACCAVSQRMVTIMSPRNGPAGSVGKVVRSTQRSLWVGTPAFSSAPSMLMPEPIRNVTRSSRHSSRDIGAVLGAHAVAIDRVARAVGAQVGAPARASSAPGCRDR